MKIATSIPAALVLAMMSACAIPATPSEPAPRTTSVAATPAESVQDKALDRLVSSTAERASLAKYSRGELKGIMDNVVCPHQGDLLAMTQAGKTQNVSAGDVGWLIGANATAGYC